MRTALRNSIRIVLLLGLCAVLLIETANAAKKRKSGKEKVGRGKAVKVETGRKLNREFTFGGTDVNGRYHSAGGAVAKVEQEKKMNSLIGLRGDFKDRLVGERERLKREENTSVR